MQYIRHKFPTSINHSESSWLPQRIKSATLFPTPASSSHRFHVPQVKFSLLTQQEMNSTKINSCHSHNSCSEVQRSAWQRVHNAAGGRTGMGGHCCSTTSQNLPNLIKKQHPKPFARLDVKGNYLVKRNNPLCSKANSSSKAERGCLYIKETRNKDFAFEKNFKAGGFFNSAKHGITGVTRFSADLMFNHC